MARNGSGTYALPAGNPVTIGTQITATWGNTTLSDIASEITGSVAADGQTTITGPIKFSAGSVSAPAMTFSSETNTGFYRSASSVVSLAIAGSQKYIFGASSVTLGGSASITGTEFGYLTGVTSAIQTQLDAKQPLDALLTSLAAQTTAANNVQAYSGADTPTLLTTGTSSGNIPLVGTKSATTLLAGLVEQSTSAENLVGTDDTVFPSVAGVSEMITAQKSKLRTSSSASGTTVSFTGISSSVKRFTLVFSGISTNGSSIPIVRVGTAAGIASSGYLGSAVSVSDGIAVGGLNSTSDALLASGWNSGIITYGEITFTNISGNEWVFTGNSGRSDAKGGAIFGGSVSLSDVLTQIQLTTQNGTDTFDAGTVNIVNA